MINRQTRIWNCKLECGLMPNVMAALPHIGSAFCQSSVIPFLVPRRKVWLTECRAVTLPIWEKARLVRKVNFAPGKIPSGGKSPGRCIYSVPAQETAKHRAKFSWLPLSDVEAVTKPRRENGWNLLECPKLPNWSQPLVGQVRHIVRTCGEGIAV